MFYFEKIFIYKKISIKAVVDYGSLSVTQNIVMRSPHNIHIITTILPALLGFPQAIFRVFDEITKIAQNAYFNS